VPVWLVVFYALPIFILLMEVSTLISWEN